MNFTAVRGFNAYAQFSAKVKEAAELKNQSVREPEVTEDDSRALYSEPVDVVILSKKARNAAANLAAQQEASKYSDAAKQLKEITPHNEFREWLRTAHPSRTMSGSFTQKIPGKVMNDALLGTGITVGEDEEFSINVDVLTSITVSSKNAEKAKAIQDLLTSTPMGINWGLLLTRLPPM